MRSRGIVAAAPRVYNPTGLVWSQDFSTITTPADLTAAGFLHSGNATTGVVTFQGRRCAKLDLDRITDTVKYRTELQPNNIPGPNFTAGHSAIIGQTYWYGVRIYLPTPAYNSDTTAESLIQWHDISDPAEEASGVARSSTISVVIRPHDSTGIPRMTIIIRADSKAETPTTSGEAKYSQPATIFDIGPASAFVDRWLSWVFRIKWGYTNATGETTVWVNGTKVLDQPSFGNCFNDIEGPYWKFGIYKWPWNDAPNTATGVDHRTMYVDDVRIGVSTATYSTVAR